MDLRTIEVFLTLTGELHFARTAHRLYLSPSRVSQTVRELENTVGGALFERTSRRVTLTPLGEQLRDELREPYEGLHRAIDRIKDAASGLLGTLHLGLQSLLCGGPHLTDAVKLFGERHPSARTNVTEGTDLMALRRGDVDVLACRLPVQEPDITVGPTLTCQGRLLAVPVGHPVVARGYATLEDVADHAVVEPRVFTDEMMDAWVPRSAPSGRPIERRPGPCGNYAAQVLTMIAIGEVVHPTVASFPDYYTYPGIACVPLHDMPPSKSALVWLTARHNPLLPGFVATLRELVEAAATGRR